PQRTHRRPCGVAGVGGARWRRARRQSARMNRRTRVRLRAGVVQLVAGGATAAALAATATSGVQLPAASRHASGPSTLSLFPMLKVPAPRAAAAPFGGYTTTQIRAAYFLKPLLRKGINGRGQSIVIVDSFGSPTIRHDLQVFDRQFRLP